MTPTSPLSAGPEPTTSAPPRWRGTGLLASGSVLSLAAFSLQITGTVFSVGARRSLARGELGDAGCGNEGCSAGWLYFTLASGPTFALSAGLLGGGMHLAGRRAAHEDITRGRVRDARWMMGVGYGLLGTGLGVLTVGSLVGDSTASVEASWFVGPALSTAGAMLAGFGTSYHVHVRRNARHAQLRIIPQVGRGQAMLSLHGRF